MKTVLWTLAALAALGPAAARIDERAIDRALARVVAGKGADDRVAGAPTVFVADPGGALLNRDRVFDLTTAASPTVEAITDYFGAYAAPAPNSSPSVD
jgi:hypothetical protein